MLYGTFRFECVIYTMGMVQIMVVDHYDLVRIALETRLRSAVGLEIVGSTSDYAEAVSKAQQVRPDVILLETKAPGGLETLRMLCNRLPQSAILVLTTYPDSQEEDETRRLGALRYLLKTLNTGELVREIRMAARQRAETLSKPVESVLYH
ncbi:MAG: response regulator transcription factor [Anaerolineae bacterium]|nr:response regulator transcription factor [Anaerolineae bacterium]